MEENSLINKKINLIIKRKYGLKQFYDNLFQLDLHPLDDPT